MYVIAIYDVEAKRCGKMIKLFRQYLTWVQNSVFEGELTDAQYKELKIKSKKVMNMESDSLIFYQFDHKRYTSREALGVEKLEPSRFL